eukprot:14563442-Heterocapsa_arctica.AAC.1
MTEISCAQTEYILAREGAEQFAADFPDTAAMAEAFSQESALYCMDILGSLDQCVGDTKQDKKKERDNYKPATTSMAVIVPHVQMGNACVQTKSVADFNSKKDMLCEKPL